jgi:hypothetical protein
LAGTAPLQVDSYAAPGTCSNFYGNAYQNEHCSSGYHTWNSTSGGYMLQSFYSSAGCQGTITNALNFQLNVCGQWSDSGSYKFVPKPLAGSVTAFQAVMYASNDCSGNPVTPSLSGTFHAENVVSQANTTMICAPTGLNNPNFAYVTVVFTPLSGAASGFSFARYNSRSSCNAEDNTKFFMARRLYGVGGCFKDAETASNYISVAGCLAGNTVPKTLTYTYAFQGVSVATAQSAKFTSNLILAAAAYWGVPASRVSITSVTSVAGSRRRMLQSGGVVNVNVAVVAVNMNVEMLTNLLAGSGLVFVNALAPLFPGFSLYVPPLAATSSTSWATPGNIAGVVIGGVVVITFIVLLSVFIPRIQHYRYWQAPIFGHGFPLHTQQQQQQQQQGPQQVPPDAFYAAQQHVSPSPAIKVVSF